MANVVRPGLYDGVVAGAAWAVLRAAGRCMGARELWELLRGMGMEVYYGKLSRALREYNGTLFHRVKERNRIVYCAEERV